MRYNIIFVLDENLYTLKPAPKNVASNIPVVKKNSTTPVSSSSFPCPVVSSVNKEPRTKNFRRTSLFDVSEDEEVTAVDTETGMKAKS